MKQGLGIALSFLWAFIVLPFAWNRLFPGADGFSVAQFVAAIVGASLLYLFVLFIGEIVENRHGSDEHEPDSSGVDTRRGE